MNKDPFRFYNKDNNSDDNYNIRFGTESSNSRHERINFENYVLSQEQIKYNTLIEQIILISISYNNILEELIKYKKEFEEKRKKKESIDDNKRLIILNLNERKIKFKSEINEYMNQIVKFSKKFELENMDEKNDFNYRAVYDKDNNKWKFIKKN